MRRLQAETAGMKTNDFAILRQPFGLNDDLPVTVIVVVVNVVVIFVVIVVIVIRLAMIDTLSRKSLAILSSL